MSYILQRLHFERLFHFIVMTLFDGYYWNGYFQKLHSGQNNSWREVTDGFSG